MSEQEKNSGGGADLSVVVVDTASRHKQPFHPIDMQEEVHKELQHKRSKVPAVPCMCITLSLPSDVSHAIF